MDNRRLRNDNGVRKKKPLGFQVGAYRAHRPRTHRRVNAPDAIAVGRAEIGGAVLARHGGDTTAWTAIRASTLPIKAS
jgi:hypothetical protein